ncbi:MAG TPA: hypothetical protein VI199_06660 [Novosphingobium sp.]
MTGRRWAQIGEGKAIPELRFPLTVTRLVMAAGANRDFFPVHHNAEFARATGAPDMYANTFFLMGMWERSVREFLGAGARLRGISGFAMKLFATPGQTLVVEGRVLRKWREGAVGLVEFEMLSRLPAGISVGPGKVVAEVPN